MAEYRPKSVTRRALSEVFKDHRTVRAFEQLFDIVPFNIDSDDNANTLAKMQKYLLANSSDVVSSTETSDVSDSLNVYATSNEVTVTLHNGALVGKIIMISFIEGSYKCYIDGGGNKVQGEAFIELFVGESAILQSDSDNNWWIR